ncbi:nucleolar and spindle-associated protein 1 [Eucyclogobius newberryi]|uniref:nucleolar and spindle-associated protein 1 n=1 Tax=Eucyclogobius newberryi TaxID=166745 RepID=UPI003B5B9E61
MDLDSMKYAALQKLAKELGLKANMKADKLLQAIKQHYEHQGKEQNQEENNDATPDPPKPVKESTPAAAFVNTRRGKRAGAKRKMSDAASTESEEAASAPEESVAPSEPAKRRRVSAKTEKTEAHTTKEEPQAERKALKGGKIPRLQKKVPINPVTPNFKKLHEAQFNKMESIDSYVQRKTKHMETYKNTVKELKKPKQTRTSLFSPAPASKSQVEEKRRHTLISASKTKTGPKKSVGKADVIFKPTVLSTRRINVRFSAATKDNEHKKSLIKTPARMSPCVASSTPLEKPGVKTNAVKITTLSAIKTPGPFVFTGNTSTNITPGTQKKNAFDIKASLARPLGYKPHTGKLKPFAETKENSAANKSVTVTSHQKVTINSHQKNYKQHQVQTRNDRRAKHNEDRKQKKNDLLGARRGLVMM